MTRFLAALLLCLTAVGFAPPAGAATVSIVSMRYSEAHPVPHLHYEGETAGGDVDALRALYESFVKCHLSCIGADGGATAVLTMNGPGGSYSEGLALADFLRENHIATVVERGAYCYSACAFAFLGGSAWSSQDGVGTYIDRMVEPGSIVGFHSPYADEASFREAMEARGAMAAQGDTRDSLALMVKELVKWNVDPEVFYYMVGKGPTETYNLLNADDLYLARVSLPPTPTLSWITDIPSAVRNACTYLLAIDERGDPLDMQERFLSNYTEGIGKTRYDGAVNGYRLGDRVLDIGSCGITETSLTTDGDFEVGLYFTPGLDGFNAPGTTLFNRQQGWSTAGTGHNPLKRIFQKGALNALFLPVGVPIEDLDLPGEQEIDKARFLTTLAPLMPTLPDDLVVDSSGPASRVSHVGDVWVFEQTGPKRLYAAAVADSGLGRTYTNQSVGDDGFIREGSFDDTGASFSSFGFADGDSTAVIDAIVIKPDGSPATADDLATLRRIQCAAQFDGLSLDCG